MAQWISRLLYGVVCCKVKVIEEHRIRFMYCRTILDVNNLSFRLFIHEFRLSQED